MTRKRTSAAEAAGPGVRVTLVTMDTHAAAAAARAERALRQHLPGLRLRVHAAAQWADAPAALEACRADIADADLVIATMLFLEDHFQPILPALLARRSGCDAMVCLMSAPEVTRLTRMGRLDMSASPGAAMGWLKRLRGGASRSGGQAPAGGAGAQQMRMLRLLPRLLRFIPGSAQDLRAWFLSLQYWLAGSQDNLAGLVRLLVDRYADGPRRALRGTLEPPPPLDYPDVGLYHPALRARGPGHGIVTDAALLPDAARQGTRGTVGLLLLRSYVLAANTAHYDGVIAALQAQGLRVLPVFATGLDQRPAIDAFLAHPDGRARIDALVSLTGFSLIGGPAYNDAATAENVLARLDVPYLAVQPLEFQTLAQWGASERGLLPVESTIMVAIPELDGATGSMVYGGRGSAERCTGCERSCHFPDDPEGRDMQPCPERAERLAARVARWVDLRRSRPQGRRVAIVLFNFPPNAGAAGTAAFLSVMESLHATLAALQRDGCQVDLPPDVQTLRERLLQGNAARYGTPAHVHHRIPAGEHVRREPHLAQIEAQWGPAPGRQQSDGRHLFVLGEQFGDVFVGLQPAFGYEGDPMRLLFERGFTPTHAFSAFYRWLREDFKADVVLHFGTHGALEFMPGKQTGLSAQCWPERLLGDLPNVYLYAANNPSEGTLAKRRSAATLVSHLTPPLSQAGWSAPLAELKGLLDRHRTLPPEAHDERHALRGLMREAADTLHLVSAAALTDESEPAACPGATAPNPARQAQDEAAVLAVQRELDELAHTLIPHGLHVLGRAPSLAARTDWLQALAEARHGRTLDPEAVQQMLIAPDQAPTTGDDAAVWRDLLDTDRQLCGGHELDGLLRALSGRYLRPAPGGDLLRQPDVLPTGRNLHGFDPFRLPSAWALKDGAAQAERLLARHRALGHPLPETVALVLWGTDTLKSEGAPVGQALALLGATARMDSYGRLAGAALLPLSTLGRPRIDVVMTLSGIFRDLLPLQVRLLAEAAYLAASADEPLDMNPVRRHALAWQAEHGGDLETAALRVFGNAEGAYGANVNHLVDSSLWTEGDELAETFSRRKGFAYGRQGRALARPALLTGMLADVDLAYQNLDSVELGVTTVDTYFDTLGGITSAARRARAQAGRTDTAGDTLPVYISDQTHDGLGGGRIRTLGEQVALETRTRMLNPAWYEPLLAHGAEGVRHIEVHVTNTVGWSATTGQVAPWVYEQLSATFVLDPAMRERLAELNPTASLRLAQRLIEAGERNFWQPDAATLDALREAGEDLEDRVEGLPPPQRAAA